jgi:hypothetical protein
MMTATLKLTNKDLNNFINNKMPERFEEVFDDIPMYHPDHEIQKGETHRQYTEDDGREYRWFIFKDTKTDIEYCLNYTYSPEWPSDMMDYPSSIQIVEKAEESDAYEPPKPVVVPEKVLSPVEKADKELWAKYEAVEGKKVFEDLDKAVPKKVIKEIKDFLKLGNFNMYQLREKIIPVCIEYKVEQQSLWNHIQNRTYGKKK